MGLGEPSAVEARWHESRASDVTLQLAEDGRERDEDAEHSPRLELFAGLGAAEAVSANVRLINGCGRLTAPPPRHLSYTTTTALSVITKCRVAVLPSPSVVCCVHQHAGQVVDDILRGSRPSIVHTFRENIPAGNVHYRLLLIAVIKSCLTPI